MLHYKETSTKEKLDQAFDLDYMLIDQEIEEAITRHLNSDKTQWENIHKRILSVLNICSEADSKYFTYKNFEIFFRRNVTIAYLKNIKVFDVEDEFMFI